MDQQVLSDSLKYAVRLAHTEEGWISPFLDAVKSTDFEAARWKPSAEVASIWEIVAHATPYIESRLADFTGDPYPDEEDWPKIEDRTPAAWTAAQARVESAVNRLQAVLDGLGAGEIGSPVPGKKTPRSERLMDVAIHDAYHAGQVVKLRQLFAAIGRKAAVSV